MHRKQFKYLKKKRGNNSKIKQARVNVHMHWSHNMSRLWRAYKKEKLLVMSNFSFSNIVFYPFGELSAINIKFKIIVRKLFQFEIV